MTIKRRFWDRVAAALSLNAAAEPPYADLSDSASASPCNDGATVANAGANGHAQEPTRAGALPQATGLTRLPWNKRSTSVEQLQTAYHRVVELLDAMHAHMQRQDERAQQLADSVTRVAASMERLVDSQAAQGEHVARIAAHAQDASRHQAAFATIPATLESQAQALRGVALHLERSGEQSQRLTDSLNHFGDAARSLRVAGVEQVAALQRLSAGGDERVEALKDFVRQQNRRFALGLASVLVLCLGAVGTLAYALATRLSS